MPESQAPWPKTGLAGQVSAAENHAPQWATDQQIILVGYTAWQKRRDVREIWDEIRTDRGGDRDD